MPAMEKTIKKINERQETTTISKEEIQEEEERTADSQGNIEEVNLQKMIEHELEK